MSQVNEAIGQLTRRLSSLENSFVSEETDLTQRENHFDRQGAQITQQLDSLRKEIQSVRETLTHLEQIFGTLTLHLKQSVKKDEIERLSSRIDRLNFEGMISVRTLARELQDISDTNHELEHNNS